MANSGRARIARVPAAPVTDDAPRHRRSLGQCFLTDRRYAERIVALAGLGPQDRVVEIGPGAGILTRILALRAGEVIAIEIDPRWHARLEAEFHESSRVRLIRGDALEYPFEAIPSPFTVVSNLPYYISTPVLFRLLQSRARIARMVLMLQREVVDRMVAGPGSKAYGTLSLTVAHAAEVRKAFNVPSACFTPRPAVDSAVVVVTPRPAPAIAVSDEPTLFTVIRAAFAHRRKVLGNALKDGGFAPDAVQRALQAAAIVGTRRGETLTLAEFGRVADGLAPEGAGTANSEP
ncbi:MAG: ribosomal RNA small subunit methyltransferase A [Nitrospirae bacterium]|nr:ribosomal RNA small subunit methyltransferase A [Nitrospirota bacterium]